MFRTPLNPMTMTHLERICHSGFLSGSVARQTSRRFAHFQSSPYIGLIFEVFQCQWMSFAACQVLYILSKGLVVLNSDPDPTGPRWLEISFKSRLEWHENSPKADVYDVFSGSKCGKIVVNTGRLALVGSVWGDDFVLADTELIRRTSAYALKLGSGQVPGYSRPQRARKQHETTRFLLVLMISHVFREVFHVFLMHVHGIGRSGPIWR